MPSIDPESVLHVVVGVIRNDNGDVLLAQRLLGRHQQGKWEFPGGKIDYNETPEIALARELEEELGIQIGSVEARIQVLYDYPDVTVLLDVFDVQGYSGQAYGAEGQNIEWVGIEMLGQYDFPAANHEIVTSLRLPSVYAISDAVRLGEEKFIQLLEQRLRAGLRLVQFRESGLDGPAYLMLARKVVDLVHQYNGKILLNTTHSDMVAEANADGLHLNSRQLMSLSYRPVSEDFMVSASCHNEQELNKAKDIATTFAVLSPVKKTSSHPEAQVIGWKKFSDLVRPCGFPVYALGGMSGENISEARRHGAQGVALLSAAWNDEFLNYLRQF